MSRWCGSPAQAEAIWPQEKPLFERYRCLRSAMLDAVVGRRNHTRLAQTFPAASVLGVDIIDSHLDRAKTRCAALGERVRFENRSIFELGLPEAHFDLVVCRHVLQAIPHADRAVAELARVTKRGGWLHLIAEDYLMINFEPRRLDPDDFWLQGPRDFGSATGTNMRIGRSTYGKSGDGRVVEYQRRLLVVDPLLCRARHSPQSGRPGATGTPRHGVNAHADLARDVPRALRGLNRDHSRPRRLRRWHVPVMLRRFP